MGILPKNGSAPSSNFGSGGMLNKLISGAATGGALGGPAGALIGAGISGFGDVLGGLLGFSSQRSANKTNLKIARETNEANQRIAEQANLLTWKMQQEQFKYASPENQRKMLEQAGFNPYLYAGQSAHAGSGPAFTTGSGAIAPSVMPENALSQGVSNATRDFANTYAMLMDAKKKESETKSQELQNSVFLERFRQEMNLLGLNGRYQQILNQYAGREHELSIDMLEQNKLLNTEEINKVRLLNELSEYELNHIKPQQLTNLIEEMNLCKQKQKTEANVRHLNDIMAKCGISNATSQRIIANAQWASSQSQIKVNAEQARYIYEQAYEKYLDNNLKERFGTVEKMQEFMQRYSNIELTDANVRKALADAGIMEKENDSWAMNKAIDNIKKLLEAGKVMKDIFSP